MTTRVSLKSLPDGTILLPGTYSPAVAASVYVYTHDLNSTLHGGTNAPVAVTVYADETSATILNQPLMTDSNGQVPGYVLAESRLDIVASFQGRTSPPMEANPVSASDITLSPATANSPLGDPIGRTKVLGTSTIAAPSLRQFVFVDDEIGGVPGMVGDVKRITDGAMSSTVNPNQLSSPSYTFTAADVGKVVEVLGAITTSTAPNLYGYVGSVAGGVASIVSTHGGSTPVNASVTVTGATVTFGTDDSAALQTVANAVSAAGGGILGFSPFKAYWWSKHVPASNVTYDGLKATFYVMPLPSDGVNPNPAVWTNPSLGQAAHTTTVSGAGQTLSTTPSTLTIGSTAGFATNGTLFVAGVTGTVTYTGISGNSFTGCTILSGSFTATNAGRVASLGYSNITFRRMLWVGHGKEVHGQYPIQGGGGINWRVYDCNFTLFAGNGVYVADVTGARVIDNTFDRVCSTFPPGTATTGNPTNFTVGTAGDVYPLTDLHYEGNTVRGQLSAGVDLTPGSNNTSLQSVTFKAVITSNVIDSPSCQFASIIMELGGSGGTATYPAQDVVIANNTCTGGNVSAYFSAGQTPNPTLLSRIIIAGNTINTVGGNTANAAIDFRASHGLVIGNVVQGYAGISPSTGAGTVALTGDVTASSTQVLNVAGGSAILNGTPLNGTGIPSGTFLQTGAGTTTWTLSQAFTGTTQTGLAITAHPQAQNMKIADNDIHIVAGGTSTIYGIQTGYIRNSSIADNTIVFDSGVASGRGISLNNSGWIRVRDNDIENTASDGIYATGCNDLRIKSNDIYNPSAINAGANGIRLNGVTGTANLIIDNDIVDDRATHLMYNAFQTASTATNVIIRGGVWLGATSGLIDTLTGILRIENVYPYDPVGLVTVTVPATGVAVASVPYWRTFYVTASTSTVQMAIQNGPSPVIPASAFGTIRVPPGKTVTPTYTVAPTWVVEGE